MESESSEIAVKALLSILIIDTLDFLNVGKTMNDRQVAATIDLILEDYSVYKIDYFVLCFNRAKKGNYGKLYDRVDGQIILGWLAEFDLEYQQEVEQERWNEKKRIEKDTVLSPDDQPAPMPENVKELIYTINGSMLVKVPAEKTKEQILVDGIISEFNKIFDDQNKDVLPSGKRFIKVENKMLDIQEYLEFRLTQ